MFLHHHHHHHQDEHSTEFLHVRSLAHTNTHPAFQTDLIHIGQSQRAKFTKHWRPFARIKWVKLISCVLTKEPHWGFVSATWQKSVSAGYCMFGLMHYVVFLMYEDKNIGGGNGDSLKYTEELINHWWGRRGEETAPEAGVNFED